ncbi:GATA-domain-containing protein, partial [Gymnopus androsaceus JB14]
QTTAEQDMELIRSKRATTTAGATTASGQPKSKYRKRSRATPPGKCHSCNIRETPEWRRGPDGARTLCNACGLHYAKLMRKQAKLNANQNGEPPPKIDLDTLKASTKAAEAEKGIKSDENTVPGPAPQHHQGSFQVMSVMSPIEGSPTTSSDPSRLPAHHQTILPPPTSAGTMHPPPPPWAPNVTRTYTPSDQFQSQSFMRTAR